MASDIYRRAIFAYESGDFESTKTLVEKVIVLRPESPEGLALRLLRGRAYEFGFFPEGVDLEKAYADYREIIRLSCEENPEALVSAARVLFDIDGEGNAGEIERLCRKAVQIENNVHAMMLLGLLLENVKLQGDAARKWYLSAYKEGLPWGLRFYANSHAKEGHVVRAFFAHALATVTSPLLVLFKGVRGPFSEHGRTAG